MSKKWTFRKRWFGVFKFKERLTNCRNFISYKIRFPPAKNPKTHLRLLHTLKLFHLMSCACTWIGEKGNDHECKHIKNKKQQQINGNDLVAVVVVYNCIDSAAGFRLNCAWGNLEYVCWRKFNLLLDEEISKIMESSMQKGFEKAIEAPQRNYNYFPVFCFK